MGRLGSDRRTGLAAIAGFLVAVILVAGVVGLGMARPGLGLKNWLVVLFGVNAGVGGVSYESLSVLNPLDMAVLVLAALTFAGFWPGPPRRHKAWMVAALALPLVGIAVLLATGLSGRSGLMGAGLVMSCLMLGNRRVRPLAYLGIAGNALLLVGDFAATGSQAPVVAALVGVGYLLLVVWFVWLATRLLSGRCTPSGVRTEQARQPDAPERGSFWNR